MKIKITMRNIATWLIILISILPEYFRFGRQPVYQYMALLLLIITINRRILSKPDEQILIKVVLTTAIILFFPRLLHGDIMPIISSAIILLSLFISVFLYLRTEEDVQDLITVFIKVGIVMSIFALIEFIWGYNVFSLIENVDLGGIDIGTAANFRNERIRVETSFGTAIACGIYMCAINTLCLYRLTDGDKGKVLYWSGYLLSAIAVYLTQARMPLLTLILVHVIYSFRFKTKAKLVIFSIVPLIFILDSLTSKVILEMVFQYVDLIKGVLTKDTNSLDVSSAFRTLLLETLAPIILESPLIGHGQSFMDNFTFRVWRFDYVSVDNNYLGMLLRYGIIGLIAQLFPFIYSMKLMLKVKLKELCFPLFLIFVLYLINLMSVAQMSEGRFMYLLIPIVLREYLNIKNR